MGHIQEPQSDVTLSADEDMAARQQPQASSIKKARKRNRKNKRQKFSKTKTTETDISFQLPEPVMNVHNKGDIIESTPTVRFESDLQSEISGPIHIGFKLPMKEKVLTKTKMREEPKQSSSPPSSRRTPAIKQVRGGHIQTLTSHHIKFTSPERTESPLEASAKQELPKCSPGMRLTTDAAFSFETQVIEAGEIQHSHKKTIPPRNSTTSKKSSNDINGTPDSEVEETITSSSARATLGFQKQELSSATDKLSKTMPFVETQPENCQKKRPSSRTSQKSEKIAVIEIPSRKRKRSFRKPVDFNESTPSLSSSSSENEEVPPKKAKIDPITTSQYKIYNEIDEIQFFSSSSSSSSSEDDEQFLSSWKKKSRFIAPTERISRASPKKMTWLKENVMEAQLSKGAEQEERGNEDSEENEPVRKRDGYQISKQEIEEVPKMQVESLANHSNIDYENSDEDDASLEAEGKKILFSSASKSSGEEVEYGRVSPKKMSWLKKNVMKAQSSESFNQEQNDDEDDINSEADTEVTQYSPSSSSSQKPERARMSPVKLKWLRKNVMRAQMDQPSSNPKTEEGSSDENGMNKEEKPKQELVVKSRLLPPPTAQDSQQKPATHPTQPGFPPLSQLPASLPAHIKAIYHQERHGGQLKYLELQALTSYLSILQLKLRRASKAYLLAGHATFRLKQIVRNKKHLSEGLREYRKKQYENWKKSAERKWKKLGEVKGVVKVLERTVEVEWGREGMLWAAS